MATWDPAQYEQFVDHRSRPFAELLARIGASAPRLVVDLGCGNGGLTLTAARRWPGSRVVGIDSSPDMLAHAREVDTGGRVTWVHGDISRWEPDTGEPPDVVLSNAALQWVPAHAELIRRWCDHLPAGSWFAMQVPGNFGAPSHRLIREAAADHPRSGELLPLLRADPVGEPADYADLLAGRCAHVDVWETTYLQVLDPAGERTDPVLDWVRGTALRPLLDVLPAEEHTGFLDDLARRLTAAYPRRDYSVVFPFRRIFAVGRRG